MAVRTHVRRIVTASCAAVVAVAVAGCDPPSTYGPLSLQWQRSTGTTIAATPALDSEKVYVGSWDGFEYAFDQATGTQRWRTDLGKQVHPSCGQVGVTSSPAILNNALYLGGGSTHWYALDSATGGILWNVFTGDPATGHYNWSTPAVHNGHAYIGIASLCDTPLVQGKLLRVNLATRQVVNTWKVVPDGQKGGTIWTTPVVDAARNTVYVTTGNRADDATGPSQQHAEAIVALDATTLAVKSHWSLPLADPTPDSDWGTAPTFSKDSLGRDVVTAGNKNGVVYAFLRDNLSAGPIWFRRVAVPAHGPDPAAGGLYSNGYFDGRRIFYAGGLTTIKGERAEGSIRALDPRTGGLFWEKALPTKTYGALTAANGMLVVPSRDALRVLDPVTGNVLYANELGLFGAATVANGRLFIGDVPGVFRAFGFPAFPGEGEAAATAASVAPSCEPPVGDSTVTCEVRLVEGCQRLESLGALADAKAVRIARVGQPRGRVRLELHPGHECAGRPLARTTLGDDGLRLPVPAAYRTSSGTGILAVEASQPARVSVTAARDR